MSSGAAILNVCILIAVIIITPHRIGGWINTFAQNVRGMGAWGVLLTMILVSEYRRCTALPQGRV